MDDEKLIRLLIKKESGNISLPEQKELIDLLQKVTGASDAEKNVHKLFNSQISFSDHIENDFVKKSVQKLNQAIKIQETDGIKKNTIVFKWMPFLAVAALLIIIFGLSFLFIYYHEENVARPNIVITKKGSKSNIVLPDGTKVWINSDTKLTYDKSFGDQTRDVTLAGEAYFDVVKDKSHPFIVHTKIMDIKVLGTAFNVKAYENEKDIQATLLRGVIEVCLKKENSRKIILMPNEKMIVKNNDALSPINKIKQADIEGMVELIKINPPTSDSTATETQWTKNRLVFEQQKMEDIVPLLERWYNVKFIIKTRLTDKKLNGTFENDELNDVLQSLKMASNFNYSIEKDIVTIY